MSRHRCKSRHRCMSRLDRPGVAAYSVGDPLLSSNWRLSMDRATETTRVRQKKKIERGRRSPTYPLNEAIAFLRQIRAALGDGPFGREGIADALNHQPKSGVLSTKVGTLTHFALLDRENNVYRVSPLGKRLLYPEHDGARNDAVAEAAAAPSLYKDLLVAFQGKAIPTLFKNVLIQSYGVASGSADDVAECFRQTMEFAGYLRHGVLHERPIQASNDSSDDDGGLEQDDESEDAPQSPDNSDMRKKSVKSSIDSSSNRTADSFSIPLSKGRTASLGLPRPLNEADHQRLIAWLDLMKDVLIEGPGEEE